MARTVDPERVERKRREMAETAARLFSMRGYENTSVADIAGAVGTSSASVFYYFEDKAELFRAAFVQDLQVAEGIAERAATAESPVPMIVDIIAELGADAAEPGAAGMVVEIVRRAGQDPKLVELVTRTSDILCETLTELISRGIAEGSIDPALDPREAAVWLQSVVDGAYLNATPGRNPERELRRTARGYLMPQNTHGDSDV